MTNRYYIRKKNKNVKNELLAMWLLLILLAMFTAFVISILLVLLTASHGFAMCKDTKYSTVCYNEVNLRAGQVLVDRMDAYVLAVSTYYPDVALGRIKFRVQLTTQAGIEKACMAVVVPMGYHIAACINYGEMTIYVSPDCDECILYHEIAHAFNFQINSHMDRKINEAMANSVATRIANCFAGLISEREGD